MAPTHSPEHSVQQFQQALRGLAGLLDLDPDVVVATGCVESGGVRFFVRHEPEADFPCASLIAELGDLPHDDVAVVLRELLEVNSQVRVDAGFFVAVPGTSRIARRVLVPLREDVSNAERLLAIMVDHLAACADVRRMGVALGATTATANQAS